MWHATGIIDNRDSNRAAAGTPAAGSARPAAGAIEMAKASAGERETELTRCHGGAVRGHAQVRAVRRDGWTKARRLVFLEHLAATCNVTLSAEAAGMDGKGVYRLRQRDSGFRAAWADALREGYAALELELLHRARFGTEKPVFHAGKQVGVIRSYSDTVALRLLLAHKTAIDAERAREGTAAAEAGAPGLVIDELREKLREMRARKEAARARLAGDEDGP